MPYKNRNERKLKGLCRNCPNPVVPGYSYCAWHAYKATRYQRMKRRFNPTWAAEERERVRINRAKRIAEGKCPNCGAPLHEDDNRICTHCSSMQHTPLTTIIRRGLFYDNRRSVNETDNQNPSRQSEPVPVR